MDLLTLATTAAESFFEEMSPEPWQHWEIETYVTSGTPWWIVTGSRTTAFKLAEMAA